MLPAMLRHSLIALEGEDFVRKIEASDVTPEVLSALQQIVVAAEFTGCSSAMNEDACADQIQEYNNESEHILLCAYMQNIAWHMLHGLPDMNACTASPC